jgi:hypothetical protein
MDEIQGKRNVSVWRLAAVIICLTWITDFLVRVFILEIGPREHDLLPFPAFLYFYAIAGILFIVTMFFPCELYIHGGLCWLWGLLRVIDGGSMAAVAVHLLGYLFLFRRGVFRTHLPAKVIVASLIFIVAFVSQIRYGIKFLVERSLQLFDFSLLVIVASLIFYPDRRNSSEPLILHLDTTRFTAQDVAILQKVLSNEKYQNIASEYGMGTSTFKKRIGGLYAEIGVQDRMDFMSRYARHTIELSPSSREPIILPTMVPQ